MGRLLGNVKIADDYLYVKSPLHYIGSKDEDLSKFKIDGYDIYVEPFSGGFNTGLRLVQSGYKGRVILNDINKNVVSFWKSLKEDSDKLCSNILEIDNIIDTTCRNSEEAMKVIDAFRDTDDMYLIGASEYIYRKALKFKELSFNKRVKDGEIIDLLSLDYILRHIEIRDTDYRNIMTEFDSEKTFMFIDPPYINNRCTYYYSKESGDFDHVEMSNYFIKSKCKILLTYNNCELIRELYKGYKSEVKEWKMSRMNSKYSELYIENRKI